MKIICLFFLFFADYFKIWDTPLGYPIGVLIGAPLYCGRYLDKVKILFQCITYLLLVPNTNANSLKYIRCKKAYNTT